MSNSDTEREAIALVKNYLVRTKGVRKGQIKNAPKGSGYDLALPDGTKIEVKGSRQSKFNYGLRLNTKEEIKFFENGGTIYRVLDVFGSPKIYIVSGKKSYLSKKQWATCSIPAEELGEAIQVRRRKQY